VSRDEIETEVDRYIGMPGQALAYKVGQREILRLRAEAEARLGARFSLPGFHDVVLVGATVSLPVLARTRRGLGAGRAQRLTGRAAWSTGHLSVAPLRTDGGR
jgi:hypothetical protein